jgi:hypothetical protein
MDPALDRQQPICPTRHEWQVGPPAASSFCACTRIGLDAIETTEHRGPHLYMQHNDVPGVWTLPTSVRGLWRPPSVTAASAPSESRFQRLDGAFRCARVVRRIGCGLCRPRRGLCRPGGTERSMSYRTYPVDSAGQTSSKTANSLQLAIGRQGPHRQSGLSTAGLTGEESQERGYGRGTRPSECARTARSARHG